MNSLILNRVLFIFVASFIAGPALADSLSDNQSALQSMTARPSSYSFSGERDYAKASGMFYDSIVESAFRSDLSILSKLDRVRERTRREVAGETEQSAFIAPELDAAILRWSSSMQPVFGSLPNGGLESCKDSFGAYRCPPASLPLPNFMPGLESPLIHQSRKPFSPVVPEVIGLYVVTQLENSAGGGIVAEPVVQTPTIVTSNDPSIFVANIDDEDLKEEGVAVLPEPTDFENLVQIAQEEEARKGGFNLIFAPQAGLRHSKDTNDDYGYRQYSFGGDALLLGSSRDIGFWLSYDYGDIRSEYFASEAKTQTIEFGGGISRRFGNLEAGIALEGGFMRGSVERDISSIISGQERSADIGAWLFEGSVQFGVPREFVRDCEDCRLQEFRFKPYTGYDFDFISLDAIDEGKELKIDAESFAHHRGSIGFAADAYLNAGAFESILIDVGYAFNYARNREYGASLDNVDYTLNGRRFNGTELYSGLQFTSALGQNTSAFLDLSGSVLFADEGIEGRYGAQAGLRVRF